MNYFAKWSSHWESLHTPWASERANEDLFTVYEGLVKKVGIKLHGEVLVPLCGNSPSIKFLYEHGHCVTGVEYVSQAMEYLIKRDFSTIPFEIEQQNGVTHYSADRLHFIQGDFFAAQFKGPFSLVYDRAALVALYPEQRQNYIKKIDSLLVSNSVQFVSSYECDGVEPRDPPFPLRRDTIKKFYSNYKVIEEAEIPLDELPSALNERGVTEASRTYLILQKK